MLDVENRILSTQVAISFISKSDLREAGIQKHFSRKNWGELLGINSQLSLAINGVQATYLYFGSEFCEFLLPNANSLELALRLAQRHGLNLVLVTPLASDNVIDQLKVLLPLLPQGGEVIVNDWGVASFLKREFPKLKRVAGRLLCRMIKDPRLSPEWKHWCSHGLNSKAFQSVLSRFGIERMELDLPPFAQLETFFTFDRAVSVYAPFGYVSKGRICKIGSIAAPAQVKFSPGLVCRRECLKFDAVSQRPGQESDLQTFQRGNTIHYRHSSSMKDILSSAIKNGWVNRVVIPGDISEHYCTN